MSHRWPERPGGKQYIEPKKKVAPKPKFDTAPLPTPSKGPKLSTGWRSTAALEQEVATLRLRLHERVSVEQQLYAKLRSAELRLATLGGNNSLTNPDLADPESRMNALIARIDLARIESDTAPNLASTIRSWLMAEALRAERRISGRASSSEA